jgi:ketosteroid isomerase-like protein
MPVFNSSEACEEAFYAALSSGDLRAMMGVWADGPNIVCVHPTGVRLEGRRAIAAGWRRIFRNPERLLFRRVGLCRQQGPVLAVHTLYEVIRILGGDGGEALTVATNVYRHNAEGWRMLLHHASPASAETASAAPVPSGRLH